jgi:predicted GIY-YIG superfamily endonuclease
MRGVLLFTVAMHYVYILRSVAEPKRIYVGCTQDIRARFEKHCSGEVPHTSKFRPWKIVWYCAFQSKDKAYTFEKYLKIGSGQAFSHKRLI